MLNTLFQITLTVWQSFSQSNAEIVHTQTIKQILLHHCCVQTALGMYTYILCRNYASDI